MQLEPDAIVLYVDNLAITSQFYEDVLNIKPETPSPTFHAFSLSNGMSLALKTKDSVEPAAEGKNGHGELAFTLDNKQTVDTLFTTWQAKKVNIILPPTNAPYGYTFVACDPDGNRLRVVSLTK